MSTLQLLNNMLVARHYYGQFLKEQINTVKLKGLPLVNRIFV